MNRWHFIDQQLVSVSPAIYLRGGRTYWVFWNQCTMLLTYDGTFFDKVIKPLFRFR